MLGLIQGLLFEKHCTVLVGTVQYPPGLYSQSSPSEPLQTPQSMSYLLTSSRQEMHQVVVRSSQGSEGG